MQHHVAGSPDERMKTILNEDKDIKFDIEEIKYQADMIAGLSHVFELYTANIGNDNQLKNALKCLSNNANKHRDACTVLMDKVFEK